MNRREFLTLSAALGAGTVADSCLRLSPRYCLPEPHVRPEEVLLIRNASIVDVSRGTLRSERHILIQHGKIAGILYEGSERSVSAHRVMDLDGAYVMPGIINAHCHMSISGGIGFGPRFLLCYTRQLERNAEECIKHGVTTVRDMLAVSDFLTELKEKIARGDVIGPRIVSCCALDKDESYGDRMTLCADKRFWREVNTAEQGRTAVRSAVDNGADFIKLFQQPTDLFLPGKSLSVMDGATLRAIHEEADRVGTYVALHHTETAGLEKALSCRAVSLEHIVTDRLLREEEIRKLVEGGHTIVPTASVAFALAYERRGDANWGKGVTLRISEERTKLMPGLIEEFCEPELVGSTLAFFRRLSDPDSYESWHLLPWPDPTVMNAAANVGFLNANALYEAGMTFGCGNDGGVPLIFPGAMGLEMVLLEEQGMKAADILRMATLNNARLLRLDAELGTVETGKTADLVVFENNPLETVRNAMHPRKVFQAGRLVWSA